MATFQKVKIKDIGRVITGKTPPTTKREFFDGDFPFITPSDIPNYKVRRSNIAERTLSETWKNKAKNYILPKNAICYVCIGSTIGKSCVIDKVSFSNQQINSIICDTDLSDSNFIFYLLKDKLAEIKSIAGSSGSAKGIINKTMFENFELSIPNLPTQTRIATVLSAHDDLIENNEKRIKALEEMAQLLYAEWFMKFKFIGHEKVKMVDSGTEYGMVPEGWEIGKISELADVISGFPFKASTYQESGKYKIVTIKNVHDGKFVLNFDSFINELPPKLPEACVLNKGDILLSLTGNIGRICVVYGTYHVLNQRVAKLNPLGLNKREYVYLLFRQESFQQKLEAMSNGAAQQNLSPIQVKDIKVVIPTAKILDDFSKITSKYFDLALSLQENSQNLFQTRDLLIPQLVTGKRELK